MINIQENGKKKNSKDQLLDILMSTILGDRSDNLLKGIVKNACEKIIDEELTNHLGYEKGSDFAEQFSNSRNGYTTKRVRTEVGDMEMSIARDRNGEFSNSLIPRHGTDLGGITSQIISLYSYGMTEGDISRHISSMGITLSKQSISNIIKSIDDDRKSWSKSRLEKEYAFIFIDCTFLKIRRDVVSSEAVYVLYGITMAGEKQIIDFQVGGNESATVWKEIFRGLKDRGLERVLMFISDDLSGIRNAIHEEFPKSDLQLCVVHKMRAMYPKIKEKHMVEFKSDFKQIYTANSKESAVKTLDSFCEKWHKCYSDVCEKLQDDSEYILRFMEYPEPVRKSIYTTNIIERFNKEIKKVTKNKNSFPDQKSAERLIYLKITNTQNLFSKRLRGSKACEYELREIMDFRWKLK